MKRRQQSVNYVGKLKGESLPHISLYLEQSRRPSFTYISAPPQPVCCKTMSGVPQSIFSFVLLFAKYLSSFANLITLLQFCTTYMCKQGFSSLIVIKKAKQITALSLIKNKHKILIQLRGA